MTEIPESIKNIVNGGAMPFGGLAYDICNKQNGLYGRMPFGEKVLLISKLYDVALPYSQGDSLGETLKLIEKMNFDAVVEKLSGLRLNYDGSPEDMWILLEVMKTVIILSLETRDRLNKQNNTINATAPTRFISTLFHCYVPQTVFMESKKLYRKERWLFNPSESVLKDGGIVSVEFKNQLAVLNDQNIAAFGEINFFENKGENFLAKFYLNHFLRSYTLCQCIKAGGLTPELPYPVMVNNIYAAVTDGQNINENK